MIIVLAIICLGSAAKTRGKSWDLEPAHNLLQVRKATKKKGAAIRSALRPST
jgi:hypothetical protein